MNCKLADYQRLLASWPGLSSRPDRALVDDSLVLLDHLGAASSLIDVGSGGGMPGIPLKIARPYLRVTLLEADQGKAAFLRHAAAVLDLELDVVAARAETAGHGALREAFDVACCRALAPMPVLAELCLPLVRPGGRLLAMRSDSDPIEAAYELLGGTEPRIVAAPSAARDHGVVVVVPKVGPTPALYPRRPGVPGRRPLDPGAGRRPRNL